MREGEAAGVGAVVLAAGASERMGRPKQLLEFGGETLLRRAARAALGAGCRPVVVVTGAHAEQTREELRGLDVREVFNVQWETGMASSVRAGLAALVESSAATDAVVLMLCDQPYVTKEVVRALVAAHRATGRPVVASQYGAGFGAPALFARPLFDELTKLEGAAGAKQLITRHAAEAHFVAFPAGEVDVDTPDDFSRLLSSNNL
jgi:molybdenum cofactor cytidylyltransferase